MTSKTTDWNEMATDFVNTWTETGVKMWQSWFDVMGSIPTPNPMADGQPVLKDVAQRFFDNRELLVRFLKLSVDAWKDIFPKVESGDNWQDVLIKYTEEMREQLSSFSSSYLKSSKDITELWQLYMQEMQQFSKLWLDPLSLSMGTMGKALTGKSSALIELNNFYWNLLYEETFGSLMQTPLLGPTREFNGKLLAGFDAWKDLYQASIDYQLILADIQVRSFEALMKELVSRAEKGEQVKDWKEFQIVWTQVADDIFANAFCQEDNLKIRGNFLNSLNIYRIKQQEILDLSLKIMNLPTRKEIDEIHKSVYEFRKLRQEVNQLKQQLSSQEEIYKINDELREEINQLKRQLTTTEESSTTPKKQPTTTRKQSTTTKKQATTNNQ
jgi:class III poly(R)-hydroxyalkanoic acid synthase PhaE subunit